MLSIGAVWTPQGSQILAVLVRNLFGKGHYKNSDALESLDFID
jgi:hypothetical protein